MISKSKLNNGYDKGYRDGVRQGKEEAIKEGYLKAREDLGIKKQEAQVAFFNALAQSFTSLSRVAVSLIGTDPK